MTSLVVDSSVAVKWFLIEPDSEDALLVLQHGLQGKTQLHAPSLVRLELDSVLSKRIDAGFVRKESAEQIRADFERTMLQIQEVETLRNATFQLAVETRQSVYDCLFLALALVLGGHLVTADLRFKKGLPSRILRDRVITLSEYRDLD